MTQSLTINNNITLSEVAFPFFKKMEVYTNNYGIDIYSNDYIEDSIRKRFIKYKPELYKLIDYLLKEKKLIVGFTSKSSVKYLYNRFKIISHLQKDGELGWYDKNDDKIIVIMDFNVALFGKELVNIESVVIHEIIHAASVKSPNIIKNNMSLILIPYYISIIKSISKLSINKELIVSPNNKSLENTIINLRNLIEKPSYTNEKYVILTAQKIWFKFFKKEFNLDISKINILIDHMLLLFQNNFTKYQVFYDSNVTKSVSECFDNAYRELDIISESSFGQETVYPSEIICIYSKKDPTPNHIVLDILNSKL